MSRTRVCASVALGLALLAGLGVAGEAVAGEAVAGEAAAAGTTVFVSPSGDGTAPGTPARPVRTLSRARDLARAADHGATVTVQLADGVYRLPAPLVLDARDSGVTWTGAPGAHPLVSGGVPVTGWSIADPARGPWSAPGPAGPDAVGRDRSRPG